RAGYTEPRLRQFWGSAASEALTRNNAAPAIHHCTDVLAAKTAGAFDRGLASLALLFHFHRRVAATAVRPPPGEPGGTAAEAGTVAIEAGEAIAPCALRPYALPVGVPRGWRSGEESLCLVADHGTLVTPETLGREYVLGRGGAGRTLVNLTPRDQVDVAAD